MPGADESGASWLRWSGLTIDGEHLTGGIVSLARSKKDESPRNVRRLWTPRGDSITYSVLDRNRHSVTGFLDPYGFTFDAVAVVAAAAALGERCRDKDFHWAPPGWMALTLRLATDTGSHADLVVLNAVDDHDA